MRVAKSIAVLALLCALVALIVFAVRLEIHVTSIADTIPGALDEQISAVRIDALQEIDAQARLLQGELHRSVGLVNGQIGGLQRNAFGEIAAFRQLANQRIGDSLTRVDTALGEVRELQADLAPVLSASSATISSVGGLADAYKLIPAQLGQELAPSWAKLQPEITCRQLDGTGYGSCWHARITALMGEAANVGGVFTQRFPQFATSVDGIATDVHTFTRKAVAPRGFWGTFKDIFATASGGIRAAGAAGLFEQRAAFRRLPPLQTSAMQ
jgi:hypothetical protein